VSESSKLVARVYDPGKGDLLLVMILVVLQVIFFHLEKGLGGVYAL
jgi:hypothetical protein